MISYSQGDRVGASVRRLWSRLRWVLVGAGLPLIWACNDHALIAPTPDPSQVGSHTFRASLVNKLDVLFMVDNSSSMAPLQNKLVQQFGSFMDPLKTVPTPD